MNRPVDFDAVIGALHSVAGQMIDVTIGPVDATGEFTLIYGAFSGVLADVTNRKGDRVRWRATMEATGKTENGAFYLDRDWFESADFETPFPKDDPDAGKNWALKVKQRGIVTDILVYD